MQGLKGSKPRIKKVDEELARQLFIQSKAMCSNENDPEELKQLSRMNHIELCDALARLSSIMMQGSEYQTFKEQIFEKVPQKEKQHWYDLKKRPTSSLEVKPMNSVGGEAPASGLMNASNGLNQNAGRYDPSQSVRPPDQVEIISAKKKLQMVLDMAFKLVGVPRWRFGIKNTDPQENEIPWDQQDESDLTIGGTIKTVGDEPED